MLCNFGGSLLSCELEVEKAQFFLVACGGGGAAHTSFRNEPHSNKPRRAELFRASLDVLRANFAFYIAAAHTQNTRSVVCVPTFLN